MMMPFEDIDLDEERIERSLDGIKGYEEPVSDEEMEASLNITGTANEKEDEKVPNADEQRALNEDSEDSTEIITKTEENTGEPKKDKTDETADITTDIIDKNCSEDESADEGEEEVSAGEDIEEKEENNE